MTFGIRNTENLMFDESPSLKVISLSFCAERKKEENSESRYRSNPPLYNDDPYKRLWKDDPGQWLNEREVTVNIRPAYPGSETSINVDCQIPSVQAGIPKTFYNT